ncbi:AMIN domain-containing protein [bacterium]|nr:AMIN domain-containing protein [bacterium]
MRRWIMGGLTIVLILGMVGGILLAQEEEVYPPVEKAAYSPEEVIPVVEPVVPAPARPTNAIQNIEVVDLPEKVRIIIHTTQPAEYIIGKVYKTKMLYVDILNSVNDLPRKRLWVKKGAVKRIRSSQYQVLPTEITRIVIDLEKWVKHEVAKEGNKLYLEFHKPEVLIAKAPSDEKAPLEEEEKVPPEEEKAPPEEERLISLSFTDAPMSAVLSFLAEMSGYNIVASAEVTKGTLTITLKDVPVMTAMDTILEMQGLWYKKVRNIIRIMTLEEFQATLAVKSDLTRIFALQYADADGLAGVLNNVLGGAVKMKAPTKLSITSWAARSEDLSSAIEATKSVTFKGKTFAISDKRTNSLIITTDDPRNFIMLERLIKELDTEVPQVLLEAAIIEVTLDDNTAFGISWVWKTLHTGAENIRPELKGVMRWDDLSTVAPTAEGYEAPTLASDPALYWEEAGLGKLLFYNKDVTALLQALAATRKVDVLSTPRILTLNNEPATIQVGQEYPVKYGWDDFRYRDLGVILSIIPQINRDKFVNVEVRQEILKYVGDSALNLPIFDKRIVKSNALVKSGHTMVIGGMIEKRTTDDVKKIPWLGDIPVLKYLFRRTSKRIENIELMVLITPYVITSPGEGTRMTRKQVRDLSTAEVSDEDIHVPEAKIEIPELEEDKIPEIEEKQ